MNRGVLQDSPVQQMMAGGNPSWWPNINNLMRPPMISSHHHLHHHQQQQQAFISPYSNNCHNDNNNNVNGVLQAHYAMNMATPSSSSWLGDDHQEQHQQLHESWSQLLLGGVLMGEEKKMDTNNWEEQVVLQHQEQQEATHYSHLVDVKQESSVNSYNNLNNNNNNNNNGYNTNHDQEFQLAAAKLANWSHHPQLTNIPVSSPQSCVTSFSSSNNLLDFSSSISSENLHSRNPTPAPDHTSECNSTATGGAAKKAKIQPSSTQSNTTLKVRKEKLGDRITALHQLVSPFGKTDTASVLLEAIGYIRFLQSQIEALSLPYLNNGAGNTRQPHSMQGERKCIFPEDPGQLLNDNILKRKGGPDQDSSSYGEAKDLRSRGLCLVPVSCTLHVGSDNGADYWAPAALGGGFR